MISCDLNQTYLRRNATLWACNHQSYTPYLLELSRRSGMTKIFLSLASIIFSGISTGTETLLPDHTQLLENACSVCEYTDAQDNDSGDVFDLDE